ncbi:MULTISPECIES: hypothetical protein [unclassified Rhodococcus (in: high G+C Gram-positive bacteria)]|uniref:hypothetical protein n=1 Tax=unclassified Rhodococcus (in: high G+C Gram-positive bacteria) TaxID=192944 RepID=UPI00163AA40E|nr:MULTISPECIES: hypothetical protein [unclassified Rhodococcus (in: high G+C Gram-positive bacteria)]MBC2639671.1 hypothetical protein [Rhodococcus sp. 3A]MBC2895584.1 hypothetical protein [Rhodococcus sp. 4CII]
MTAVRFSAILSEGMRILREIEIHQLKMDYHLAGMENAHRSAVQRLLIAIALICPALGRAYGWNWYLASIPFVLGSLGPGFVLLMYRKEWRRAYAAFEALEVTGALTPFLDAVEDDRRHGRKTRWWRRVRLP